MWLGRRGAETFQEVAYLGGIFPEAVAHALERVARLLRLLEMVPARVPIMTSHSFDSKIVALFRGLDIAG